MGNRHQPATGTAAALALALVQTEARRVSAWACAPCPMVNIVAGLRDTRDDSTADIRPLNRGHGHEMNMPLRVVQGCSPAALQWLVAHEVGHTVAGNSVQKRLRIAALTIALASAILSLLTTVGGAVTELSGGSDPWMLVRLSALGFFLLMLLGISALKRHDELNADAFAVAYLGDIRGAEQYFAFVEESHRTYSAQRFIQTIIRPLRSHPTHHERLQFMRAQLGTGPGSCHDGV